MEYKILKSVYVNEYGVESKARYYIQKKFRFLLWIAWFDITHTVPDDQGTVRSETLYFDGEAEAIRFYNNVLKISYLV